MLTPDAEALLRGCTEWAAEGFGFPNSIIYPVACTRSLQRGIDEITTQEIEIDLWESSGKPVTFQRRLLAFWRIAEEHT